MRVKTLLNKLTKPILSKGFIFIFLLLFVLFGVFYRVQELGYSNLQGDEVVTLNYLRSAEGEIPSITEFWQFLLNRQKGPVQFVITYINTSLFGYINELQIRVPFAVFGILSIAVFYLLSKRFFSESTAIWVAILLSINGLFIAFSRISQYQTILHLLIPLGILVYIKGVYENNLRWTAVSGGLMGIALLAHYDTLSALPFWAGFGLVFLARNRNKIKNYLYHSIAFILPLLTLALLFYVPFILNPAYQGGTSDYLGTRLFGGGFVPQLPNVLNNLLIVYMPAEGWIFLAVSILTGLLYLGRAVDSTKLKIIYYASLSVFCFAVVFSLFPIKPRTSTLLIYASTAGIFVPIVFSRKILPERAGVLLWFLFSFAVYFYFIRDPRTHVYTAIMPGLIIAGYGVSSFLNSVKGWLDKFSYSLVFLFLFYITAINWFIFVHKNPEYPWFPKQALGRDLYTVERDRYKKVEGIFGFNHYRHWEETADLYKEGCLTGTYNSNEKNIITSFYIGFDQQNTNDLEFPLDADTIIKVEGPHSWNYVDIRRDKIEDEYALIKTFENRDYTVTQIWGRKDSYPNATLLCE